MQFDVAGCEKNQTARRLHVNALKLLCGHKKLIRTCWFLVVGVSCKMGGLLIAGHGRPVFDGGQRPSLRLNGWALPYLHVMNV